MAREEDTYVASDIIRQVMTDAQVEHFEESVRRNRDLLKELAKM